MAVPFQSLTKLQDHSAPPNAPSQIPGRNLSQAAREDAAPIRVHIPASTTRQPRPLPSARNSGPRSVGRHYRGRTNGGLLRSPIPHRPEAAEACVWRRRALPSCGWESDLTASVGSVLDVQIARSGESLPVEGGRIEGAAANVTREEPQRRVVVPHSLSGPDRSSATPLTLAQVTPGRRARHVGTFGT